MLKTETRIRTDKAGRYLAQLCKHFAHKAEADWSATEGKVDFGFGECRMRAEDGCLYVSCASETAPGLGRVKFVLTDHIVRFGWKEKLVVDWPQDEAAPAPSHQAGAGERPSSSG